jgi:zinc/manganese transport system ATP-binding protein
MILYDSFQNDASQTPVTLECIRSYCFSVGFELSDVAVSYWSDPLIMTIRLNNLTIAYERHPAVHHITASIDRGEFVAIVGPNGAGKSTLLNAMAGLTTIHDGSIEGLCPTTLAYLPQQAQLDKSFPITVFELVTTGLWATLGFSKPLNQSLRLQCEEAIAAVGLQGFEHRMINTLSGGQLQRCLFARVLVQDQPVILLDEPFNAIDAKTLADLTRMIKQWHKSKRTIIMVTHDIAYVQQHCPQTMLLARECIGHGPTNNVLTAENLKRARQLSEAFDDHAQWCRQGVA